MSGAPGVCRCSAYLRPFVRHAAATRARTKASGPNRNSNDASKNPFLRNRKTSCDRDPAPGRARARPRSRGARAEALPTNGRSILFFGLLRFSLNSCFFRRLISLRSLCVLSVCSLGRRSARETQASNQGLREKPCREWLLHSFLGGRPSPRKASEALCELACRAYRGRRSAL